MSPTHAADPLSIWLSPAANLVFAFAGGRPPKLNPTWLKVLAATSNTPRGMVVVSEDEAESYAKNHQL